MKLETLKQIFRIIPTLDLILKLIKCYGLTGLDDQRSFTKQQLVSLNTINKVSELIPELAYCYVPCKAVCYLYELRVLTVLRHFLRVVNYKLVTRDTIVKGKKTIYYSVKCMDKDNISYKIDKTPKIIYFS